jgi:hypothetical protein
MGIVLVSMLRTPQALHELAKALLTGNGHRSGVDASNAAGAFVR